MSGPPTTQLLLPSWIDWDATNSNGLHYYRKLTNLHGGIPGSGEMNWLSYFTTEVSDKSKPQYNSIQGPQYEPDPKNLWFFDARTANFKLSDAKSDITYTIDPLADSCGCSNCTDINQQGQCYCKNKDKGKAGCTTNNGYECCANSSANTTDCVYRWHRQQESSFGLTGGEKTNCGGKKDLWKHGIINAFKKNNHWSGPYNSTCDKWSYVTNASINGPDGPQDISGTFCVNTQNQDVFMRTYLGCDCDRSAAHSLKCTNMQAPNCTSSKPDDFQISDSKYPKGERGIWQYIDDAGAFACCSQSDVTNYPQCQFAFNPTKTTNKCPAVAQQYCEGNWGKNTEIGNQCQGFLVESKANYQTTQDTIQNYITSRVPQDYISYPLWQVAGDPLSKEYYTSNSCFPNKSDNGCDIDPTNPCCRDDSTDPFFTNTMPYLCNFQYDTNSNHTPPNSSMAGVCDLQLQYFCQSFTRDQLAADLTLQNICGCNLLTNPASTPYNPNVAGVLPPNNYMNLERCSSNVNPPVCEKPDTSPYYINANTTGDNCDIICNTALIQSQTLGGKCTQPVCTIDNVTINQLNSTTGNTTISQDCNGGTCYIVDVDIIEINSAVGGNQILQNCSACYYTNGDDLLTAQPVDCNTLKPIGGGGGGGLGSWWSSFTQNTLLIIILLVIIGIVVVFFIASYYQKKYDSKLESMIPPEGIAFGDEYWDQY